MEISLTIFWKKILIACPIKTDNYVLKCWVDSSFNSRMIIQTNPLSIILYLIFKNIYFTKLIFELDFLSIWNLIFAGYTGSKNQVWNRQKIKFKIQFREIQILKNQVQIDRKEVNSALGQIIVTKGPKSHKNKWNQCSKTQEIPFRKMSLNQNYYIVHNYLITCGIRNRSSHNVPPLKFWKFLPEFFTFETSRSHIIDHLVTLFSRTSFVHNFVSF